MGKNATSFIKNDKRINREGRPKGTLSLVTKMREALDKIHDGTSKPYHELLVSSMVKDAIKTDGQSRRLMLQYLEGMPKETMKVEVTLPKPLLDGESNDGENHDSNEKTPETQTKD